MLKEYKRKRDFTITPEPSGSDAPERKAKKKSALTFVIQKHAATRLHYDFRLEIDGVMVSWAVPKGPSLKPADKRLAVMTEDHPIEYSSFEGIIPDKQYGAGEVIIWDQGIYSPDENQTYSWEDKEEANKRMREGVKKGKLSFYLKGEKLEGSWTLVRLHGKEKEWLLIKHHDKFDSEKDITEEDASVVSGKTLADLQEQGANRIWTSKGASKADPKTTGKSTKKGKLGPASSRKTGAVANSTAISKPTRGTNPDLSEAASKKKAAIALTREAQRDVEKLLQKCNKASFPKKIVPMLATLADAAFSQKGWFFEPKLDGVRAIAYVKDGECRLSSRNLNDLSAKYPQLCKSLAEHKGEFVFDGEVVALDLSGKPSFQHLQQSGAGLKSFSKKVSDVEVTLNYYVFDILHVNGKDVTVLPLTDRKEILRAVLRTDGAVRLVDSLGSDGPTVFQACAENGLEGIVGKVEDSIYEVGKRSRSWLKIKTSVSGDFIVCGYTEGTGSRGHTFGSLLLGEYDEKGELVFVGGVGTGLTDKKLDAVLKRMKPLTAKRCPFKAKPKGRLNPTWLQPELVVEVKYLERTRDNILRSPVFMHLREDLEANAVKNNPVVHIQTKPGRLKSDIDQLRVEDANDDVDHSNGPSNKTVSQKTDLKEAKSISKPKTKKSKSSHDNSIHLNSNESGARAIPLRDQSLKQSVQNYSKPESGKQVAAKISLDANSVIEQLDNEKEKLILEVGKFPVPVTSLNKVFWPEYKGAKAITKRDYLIYLAKISDYILPHLTDRLLTLVRFPNGIHESRFYQKHWEQKLPEFVKSVPVFTEKEGRDQEFLVCNNLQTLLWLGQIADLELHTSHTRITAKPDARHLPEDMTGSVAQLEASIANYPDFVVLDLDPYLYSGKEKKGAEPELHDHGFRKCCEVALWLKKHLDDLRLESFIKTSGKTGLHIFIPIERTIDYDTVRTISEILCRQVLKEHPDAVTMDWAVIKRTGKIFMDHNMNARSKSLASIYSPRVAPEACVSTPLDWHELGTVYPTQFDTHTLPQRLGVRGDLWRDILKHKNDLKSAFSKD